MNSSTPIEYSSEELVTSTVSLNHDNTERVPFFSLRMFRNVLSVITVEPVLFFYMLATFMQYAVFQDLVYEKTCLDNFNQTVCQNLNNNTEALDIVQEQSSHWILSSTIALTVPSIIVANFLGALSDTYDRKLPLIFPNIGMILASVVYILLSVYESFPISLIILASFLSGIFGGFVSCIMAVMSYISSISSQESRSMRVALLEAMTFVGGTIGPFIGGAILTATDSHSAVFLVILCCHVINIVYIMFCIPSVKNPSFRDSRPSCRQLFSCHSFVSSVKIFSKARTNFRRRNIILLIISAFMIMTVTTGEMDVSFLYTKDDPLNWTYDKYSYYFGFKYGLGALVLILLSPIARRFNLQEFSICCFGLIFKAAGLVLHGLANTTLEMFIVAPLSMFNTFCIPSVRSLLSKQVDSNELGKLFAVVASIENICTLLGSVIFNSLYPLTRSIFRGMILEVAAGTLILPFIIMSYLGYKMKKELYYLTSHAGPNTTS